MPTLAVVGAGPKGIAIAAKARALAAAGLGAPRSRPPTSVVISCAIPNEGPPMSCHDRAIPIRKQTITRIAIVFTAPGTPCPAITSAPWIS